MNLVDALVLKSLPRVGDSSVINLINFSIAQRLSTLEELSEVDSSELPLRTTPSALTELFKSKGFHAIRDGIKRDIRDWKLKNIEAIVFGSEQYPKQLLKLNNPPPFLFYKGDLKLLKHPLPIAVVGTRKNTSIGEKITIRTIEEFAKYNYSVVSGLALGIDTIAHRSAINSNIPTIAVLVDIENVAPKENQDLANEILKKEGLLVSENPPGTKIIPAFFAKRDRIQAGLSAGVFAIETAIDGGTMHAVNTAILMSRPVFVPNANAAGYPDLGIKATAGTQQLVNDSKAEAYTRESYKEIRDQLEKIYTKFESNVAREMSL